MPAIITNELRSQISQDFVTDLGGGGSNTYYLFIGRTQPWPDQDPAPTNLPADNRFYTHSDAWQNMIAMKKILPANVITGVPIYNHTWRAGVTYAEYDDRDPNLHTKPYYVITENNHVYICLVAGTASTVSPDTIGVETSLVTSTRSLADNILSDGYLWKYLYSLSSTDGPNIDFKTTNFMPVTKITTDPGAGSDSAVRNQWDVQSNAVDGAIYNIKVVNPGSGYTSAPTIEVEGDGSGLAATATVSSSTQQITGVTITNPGSGFKRCNLKLLDDGGGSGGVLQAVLGPPGGFGADPRVDLRAHHVILAMTITEAEGEGDFLIGNDFRQIGLIKNPLNYGTSVIASDETLSALYRAEVVTGGSFPHDGEIEGDSSGARGYIDYYDTSGGIIWYHQDQDTGFVPFTTSDNIKIAGSTGTGQSIRPTAIPTGLANPDVQPDSGTVIYLEDRVGVNRADDQAETIQLVIEF